MVAKRIPLAAFYASLDTWVVQLLSDLRHTLEPLILLNWGRAEDFEICHKPLALQAMEQQGQAASPSANTAATTAQPTTTAQPPDLAAQGRMIAGGSPQNAPHRMSLNTRPSLSAKERQERYQRSRLIAALLTRIYGADAERYFDEAFGTNLCVTSSPSDLRHPHEFQRMSSQISRSTSLNRVPWDPLKHPRGRDGRFIEKYGIDAFNQSKSKINASLDPNASPTTGRTSDEVRPLLEHLNLLDQSQLHNLLSDYEAITTIATDSLIQRVNYQVNGDEESSSVEDSAGRRKEDEEVAEQNDQQAATDNQEQPETTEEREEYQDSEEPSESEATDEEDPFAEDVGKDESSEEPADKSEEILFGESTVVEVPSVQYSPNARGGRQARPIAAPAEKVLAGAIDGGHELYQTIANIPHDYFDGSKDSTQKIREGRESERANIAVLTLLRDELQKLYAKYSNYRYARGTSSIPREKLLQIQGQLSQLLQLIEDISNIIVSSRQSEHNMYLQELIAEKRENARVPKRVMRGIPVHIPSKVELSLIQGDINHYEREIALAIVTAGIGTGVSLALTARAARIANASRLPYTASARLHSKILHRLFGKLKIRGTKKLSAGEGRTDKFGNVLYSTLGSVDDIAIARSHELLHAALSPKLRLLRNFRAGIRMKAYKKSALMKYLEEALAESFAQLRVNGIKGLPSAIRFPIKEGYVKVSALAAEGAIGTIIIAGVTYYVFIEPAQ